MSQQPISSIPNVDLDPHTPLSTLSQIVHARHSTRMFLPTPVPRPIVDSSLALAQLAPSNSNIQPWRLFLASGAARNRIVAAVHAAATTSAPNIPPLPESFRHYRSELGLEVYGHGMGIAKDDKEGRAAAVLRNFEFFGAPLVGVVCMHRDLEKTDSLGVGMWLETLLLALTEQGLSTCVEVSVAGYPEVLRKELDIPEELTVLCGLAIGYQDPEFKANFLHIERQPLEDSVVFLED
ncbi:oxidoreductase [Glonium stellatum]|uniref:Oxidoreductase n=1 Tax=Glonium stellatum TaxID=574774 RepID=A0A8E2JMU3_9PEZI|nr:oxidoreductase [Glonium stellatum]